MERLLARDPAPDHIVIETSGLALPKPLVQAFNWPEMRARLTVDGVITVVDAPALAAGRFADDPARVTEEEAATGTMDHATPLAELFEDQLACADLVVLNKTDLVDEATLAITRTTLGRAVTAGVKMVTTTRGGLDPRVALGLAAAAEEGIARRRCHHDDPDDDHDHDEFESFVTAFGSIADPAEIERGSAASPASTTCSGSRASSMSPTSRGGTSSRRWAAGSSGYYDRDWRAEEERRSELVVIGLQRLRYRRRRPRPRRLMHLLAAQPGRV